MRAFIAVTDNQWYEFLSKCEGLDEINFWQPGGQGAFRALEPGELFLFKLHREKFVVGGGIFVHATILPISLAWESFHEKNGAASFEELRRRVGKYRGISEKSIGDYRVGCILLEQPFFLAEKEWIPVPPDWKPNIVQGKTYDLTRGYGREIRERLGHVVPSKSTSLTNAIAEPQERYGSPLEILPRLGQGSFRVMVTDTYRRRCAVTGERTLPALDAAHIKPYGVNGPHRIDNGILLRSDIHRLFERGYVTITPDYRFDVSKRIRDEFENGRDYYALRGRAIYIPDRVAERPAQQFVRWHNENIFLGWG